ncbi:hypothetical protein M758_UG112200 [Ceratodon purpureus]|nr:hypothetical protein M758_UG112200 [Ceratodon purpureus]
MRSVYAVLTRIWAVAIVVRGICTRIIDGVEVVIFRRQEGPLEPTVEQDEETERAATSSKQLRMRSCAGEKGRQWCCCSLDGSCICGSMETTLE